MSEHINPGSAAMQLKVISAHYDAETQHLEYCATGHQGEHRFTISSRVKCLKEPQTPERTHMVVLLAVTDHLKRHSPAGPKWHR